MTFSYFRGQCLHLKCIIGVKGHKVHFMHDQVPKANGLTVSQPVTTWDAGNTESKEASHFIIIDWHKLGSRLRP